MLRWAVDRAGVTLDDVRARFAKYDDWLAGTVLPTLKQLEQFAQAMHASIGYFFLPEPPVEVIPIPDYRTVAGRGVARPSPDLLDTLYICQQRQEWYREYAVAMREPTLSFVASVDRRARTQDAANLIRHALGFDIEQRQLLSRWEDALRHFISQAEDLGVLVMVSGVVGSNNNRKLNTEEFRGFALSDPLAPLVFINGSDSKSAQMFTLAHELAHLWLGESALSNPTLRAPSTDALERWCNEVAAELLVPLDAITRDYDPDAGLQQELQRLARVFKVSTLVILRRLRDANMLSQAAFWAAYDEEVARVRLLDQSGAGGGNFYNTTAARVGKRFARAIIGSALEGRASFSEALRLLGFKKMSTFKDLGQTVGVAI
jgi:Zn-dependent peptidase ImmA (M78 family)/transcriptional regulator with XRE-family HTH domain